MCEIAVLPAAQAEDNVESYLDLAQTLYKKNNDGIGFVAVYDGTEYDEGQFNNAFIKASDPEDLWGDIGEWLQSHSDAWRFVVHARLATTGASNNQNTHPLKVTDDDLDADLVVHNGVVTGSRRTRQNLTEEGHEFNTGVDSEVIAHKQSDIPDSLGEDSDFEGTQCLGRLNYLLFSQDGILVRNDGKYTLTDDFKMTCRPSKNRTDAKDQLPEKGTEDGLGSCFALFKPDGSVETEDALPKGYDAGGRNTGYYTKRGGTYSPRGATSGRTGRSYRNNTSGSSGGSSGRSGGSSSQGSSNRDNSVDDPIAELKPRYQDRAWVDPTSDRLWFRVDKEQRETLVRWGPGREDDLALHDKNSEGLFEIYVRDNNSRRGEVSIFVNNRQRDAPVTDARIYVHSADSSKDYNDSGIYTVNGVGMAHVDKPEDDKVLEFKLLTVGKDDLPSAYFSQSDRRVDDSDDKQVDPEAVNWWHPYHPEDTAVEGETTVGDGYCSLHMRTYHGTGCSDCTDVMSIEQLIGLDHTEAHAVEGIENTL